MKIEKKKKCKKEETTTYYYLDLLNIQFILWLKNLKTRSLQIDK